MIAFGSGGATPRQRMSQLSAGLGLLPGAIVDQHFEQRNRYGRLLSLVAQSPALLGLGVDEDTAAVIADGTQLEVVGRGAVTVVDGRHLVANAYAAQRTAPLLVSGAVLHVLPAGSRFDLARRTLVAHQTHGSRPRGGRGAGGRGRPAGAGRGDRRRGCLAVPLRPAGPAAGALDKVARGSEEPVSSTVLSASSTQTQPSLTFAQVSGLFSSPLCTSRTLVSPSPAGSTSHSTRPAGSADIASS